MGSLLTIAMDNQSDNIKETQLNGRIIRVHVNNICIPAGVCRELRNKLVEEGGHADVFTLTKSEQILGKLSDQE